MDKNILVGLDLKIFRRLCKAFFDQMGFRAVKISESTDPGVSAPAILYSKSSDKPFSIFQCQVGPGTVDVGVVEKFHAAMTAAGMPGGYFLSTGEFSQSAIDFAGPQKINLIDLDKFVELAGKMPESSRNILLEVITDSSDDEDDHKTEQHSCPKCSSKMLLKVSKEGMYKTGKYWLCPMPDCGHIVAYF